MLKTKEVVEESIFSIHLFIYGQRVVFIQDGKYSRELHKKFWLEIVYGLVQPLLDKKSKSELIV